MEPALVVALLWLVFGGLHIGLATAAVRDPIASRLGPLGFGIFFSLFAAPSFAALVSYYATHRSEGLPGLALGSVALLRWVLVPLVGAGIALTVAAFDVYPRSPMALFGPPIRGPRGLERVTRHPFFAGVALLALAHVLLATRLVGTVFVAGLALLAILGARHQDAKLLRLRGRPYAEYLAATSAVPFGALLAGRQRLDWRELPLGTLAAGVVLAFVLRSVHEGIFAHSGAWVIGGTLGGAAFATVQAWRRARRAELRMPASQRA